MAITSGDHRVAHTFGADHQTSAFLRTLVDSLDDVDQLLLILQHPVQFVIVSGSEIAHHVLVAVEEHDRHPVVELVHLVEVRDLVHVAKVDDREVWGESSAAVHWLWNGWNSLFTRSAIL